MWGRPPTGGTHRLKGGKRNVHSHLKKKGRKDHALVIWAGKEKDKKVLNNFKGEQGSEKLYCPISRCRPRAKSYPGQKKKGKKKGGRGGKLNKKLPGMGKGRPVNKELLT